MATSKIPLTGKHTVEKMIDAYNLVIYNEYCATILFLRTGKALTANEETLWFTVPEEVKPPTILRFNISARGTAPLECRLNTDGKLYVEPKSNIADAWVYASFTYTL